MRHIMLTVALMLWASQVEADVLFTPDSFTLNVKAVFNDTGTDTFCWQCGDANPLNDFQAVLANFPDLSGPWTSFVATSGLVDLQSTATNYLGLEANFSLLAKLTAWNERGPVIVCPSVNFGIIPGRLLGVNGGSSLVLECCDGRFSRLSLRSPRQDPSVPRRPRFVEHLGLEARVQVLALSHPEYRECPGVFARGATQLARRHRPSDAAVSFTMGCYLHDPDVDPDGSRPSTPQIGFSLQMVTPFGHVQQLARTT